MQPDTAHLIDQAATDQPFYRGKHNKHGMNLQVPASPGAGIPVGLRATARSVHGKKDEWIWGIPAAGETACLITLTGKNTAICGARHTRGGRRLTIK